MHLIKKIFILLLPCGLAFLLAPQCTEPTPPKNLTSGERVYGLIYYSERGKANNFQNRGFGGLYLTNLAIRKEKRLTDDSAAAQAYGFSWSPIVRKLLFSGRGKNGANDSNLYVLDLNGNMIQLTGDDTYDSRGRWSPNGQIIAFRSLRPDNHIFYLADTDGSNIRPVFEEERDFLFGNDFAWSPNSKRIAVSIIPDSDTEPINLNAPLNNIVIVELDRKKSWPLPDNRTRTDFSWSRDSSKLVFLSNPVDVNSFVRVSTTMYVFDTETNKEILIGEFKVIGTPVWSPTDDVIAFSAAKPGDTEFLDIYLINGDGTGLEQITEGGAYRVASWSPDGSQLAVEIIGEQLIDHEIGIVDLKKRTVEQITDNAVFDAFPIWVEM